MKLEMKSIHIFNADKMGIKVIGYKGKLREMKHPAGYVEMNPWHVARISEYAKRVNLKKL